MNITEVLNRRADLSTFVVHLTKEHEGNTAKQNLLSIISDRKIEARSPSGWAQTPGASVPSAAGVPQRVACFSETPLEHIYSLFADIDDRQVHLSQYGLALTKMTARRKGLLPVWYVDRTAGAAHQWRVAQALDRLRDYALQASPQNQTAVDIATMLPFFEAMGSWPGSQKEFWWEREWRSDRDIQFNWPEVALWFAAEPDHDEIQQALRTNMDSMGWTHLTTPQVLDPAWSLERMMAKLVGLTPQTITPFRTH